MIYVDKTKEHEMCQIDPFKKESVCEQHPPPKKKKIPTAVNMIQMIFRVRLRANDLALH